ncbi:MAG: tRNA epoxyqueuosine(34) reductase QueG [Oceanococcus sp.]
MSQPSPPQMLEQLRNWSRDLGFSALSVSRAQLGQDAELTQRWLDRGMHGDMDYLARNQALREDPQQLVPDTLSVISVTMPYWPQAAPAKEVLKQADKAYISRYALGRDYHKTVRSRLRRLARQLQEQIGPFGFRAFADSAPIFEKALARDASLGWMGKHTLLIDKQQGSYFFLGELFTDLALPASEQAPVSNGCGACQACIRACPTGAISLDGELDARRCISYLTIELKSSIPIEMRKPIGNRIFGCDDCQLVCPWNRDAKASKDPDFAVRHALDDQALHELFAWTEAEFLSRTEGMALRRSGYIGWLRNIAVALGNGPATTDALHALQSRQSDDSELVREHVEWALNELTARQAEQ